MQRTPEISRFSRSLNPNIHRENPAPILPGSGSGAQRLWRRIYSNKERTARNQLRPGHVVLLAVSRLWRR